MHSRDYMKDPLPQRGSITSLKLPQIYLFSLDEKKNKNTAYEYVSINDFRSLDSGLETSPNSKKVLKSPLSVFVHWCIYLGTLGTIRSRSVRVYVSVPDHDWLPAELSQNIQVQLPPVSRRMSNSNVTMSKNAFVTEGRL